jgi:hypothetical protein
VAQDVLDCLLQCWDFVDHHIPHNVVVHSKVAMDASVTHARHGSLCQMALSPLDLVRELLDRFPNDLQTLGKRTLSCFIT